MGVVKVDLFEEAVGTDFETRWTGDCNSLSASLGTKALQNGHVFIALLLSLNGGRSSRAGPVNMV